MKKKIGMLKSADLNEYELQNERASYKTIISKAKNIIILQFLKQYDNIQIL